MSGPDSEKESFPPPYSESASPFTTTQHQAPSHQNLVNHLTTVRATHLDGIISTHILPLISQQAASGIAETNIALLPSDVSLPAPKEKSEFSFEDDKTGDLEVIGFSSDEAPLLVRLEDQMSRTDFWRAPGVMQDLEDRLKNSLNSAAAAAAASSASSSSSSPPPAKKGLLGRLTNLYEQEKHSSPFGSRGAGGAKGQVLVKVRLEEICLRTLNDFGLYDTLSKQCVTVKVDARC